MRLSTNQIYDNASLSIQRNQSTLYKLQAQISSGRRVLSPEDDPVASAQALVVSQSADVNSQQVVNQGNATSQLGIVDTQLSSLVNLMQSVRQRVVQAGNTGTLNNSDRLTIATELQSRLGEMVGIANSQNGSGDYLFSGYQGATLPFAIDASGNYAYYGDDGERSLQVSSSQQMAVNVTGSDVFMNARGGNGTFVTATVNSNQGAATVNAGSVLDPVKWSAGLNGFPWSNSANPGLTVKFSVGPGGTTYELYDISDPATPLTVAAPYTSGNAIQLTTTTPVQDFGAQVVITGQPLDGDSFTVKPGSSQSLFQTMQSLITILSTPLGSAGSTTQFSNDLSAQLTNLDQGLSNVQNVQTTVGTRMRELDSLENAASDLDIQYATTLSSLVGLDTAGYTKAISDFTMQKTYLEAAQQSFIKVTGSSLFNYL